MVKHNPFQTRFQVIILAPNKQIELDEKRCQLRDGTRVSCVEVEVKMNYHGVGVPDSIGEHVSTEMEIQNARSKMLKSERSLIRPFVVAV